SLHGIIFAESPYGGWVRSGVEPHYTTAELNLYATVGSTGLDAKFGGNGSSLQPFEITQGLFEHYTLNNTASGLINIDNTSRYDVAVGRMTLWATSVSDAFGHSFALVDAIDTAGITGLTLADGSTPESQGYIVQFASGFQIPAAQVSEGVPEPA